LVSGAYAGTIPAEILPLEPEEERAIIGSMLAELNEKFCVGLDPNPSLDLSTPPSLTVHNAGRTVFIGGSNLGRIAKAATENGHMIVDLSDAAAAGKGKAEAKILNVLEFFGPLESNPQELTTVDGTSIWAGDGVHLTSNAARVAARKMMAYVIAGETAKPASKRARLQSVIPVRSTAPPAAKPVQPAAPPPPKLVPPPLWLSG
jgi:hypothetical protein